MKTAIVYRSKRGAAEMCAKYIASALEQCDIFDIGKNKVDIRAYDVVIVGSGVRMGSAYGKVRRFFKKNADILANKYLVLFLCHFAPEIEPKTVEKCVTAGLVDKVRVVSCGGVQPFERPADGDWIKKDNIESLVEDIKKTR